MLEAEVINLDYETKIRVKKDGYLVGYFSTTTEVEEALAAMNLSMADIEVSK